MKLVRRLRRNQRGNALIEFALSFTVLFPLFYGTFQFGYAFFIYNELHTAVRAGARYASNRIYTSSTSTPTDSWSTAVKNVVVFGNPDGSGTGYIQNFTTSNVDVSVAFVSGTPSTVTVRVSNFGLDAVFKTYTLNKPSVTFPYTGVWQP